MRELVKKLETLTTKRKENILYDIFWRMYENGDCASSYALNGERNPLIEEILEIAQEAEMCNFDYNYRDIFFVNESEILRDELYEFTSYKKYISVKLLDDGIYLLSNDKTEITYTKFNEKGEEIVVDERKYSNNYFSRFINYKQLMEFLVESRKNGILKWESNKEYFDAEYPLSKEFFEFISTMANES